MATAPLALGDRFALIVADLCRAVAARGGARAAGPLVAGPLIVLIWGRLQRLATRFAGLVARAGSPARPSASPRPPRTLRRAAPSTARPRLPEGFGWLLRQVPEAAAYAGQLQHLLDDPDVAALLAAAPQIGRALRPLCRSLGIRPGPALRPPPPATPVRRPRAASPATRPPATRPPGAHPPEHSATPCAGLALATPKPA
jgi:hypothetical protein